MGTLMVAQRARRDPAGGFSIYGEQPRIACWEAVLGCGSIRRHATAAGRPCGHATTAGRPCPQAPLAGTSGTLNPKSCLADFEYELESTRGRKRILSTGAGGRAGETCTVAGGTVVVAACSSTRMPTCRACCREQPRDLALPMLQWPSPAGSCISPTARSPAARQPAARPQRQCCPWCVQPPSRSQSARDRAAQPPTAGCHATRIAMSPALDACAVLFARWCCFLIVVPDRWALHRRMDMGMANQGMAGAQSGRSGRWSRSSNKMGLSAGSAAEGAQQTRDWAGGDAARCELRRPSQGWLGSKHVGSRNRQRGRTRSRSAGV